MEVLQSCLCQHVLHLQPVWMNYIQSCLSKERGPQDCWPLWRKVNQLLTFTKELPGFIMCLGWCTGLHYANAPRFNNNHKVNLKNILSHSKRLKQKYKHTDGIIVIIMIHKWTHTTEHIKLCVYRLPYGRMKDVLVLAPSNMFCWSMITWCATHVSIDRRTFFTATYMSGWLRTDVFRYSRDASVNWL